MRKVGRVKWGVEAKTFGAESETGVLVAMMIWFSTSVRSLPPEDNSRQVPYRYFVGYDSHRVEHGVRRLKREKVRQIGEPFKEL
jgi:hypothetical protein